MDIYLEISCQRLCLSNPSSGLLLLGPEVLSHMSFLIQFVCFFEPPEHQHLRRTFAFWQVL
jgi:hypothetical protein